MRSTTVAPLVLLGLAACNGGGGDPLTTCPTDGPDGGTTQNPDGTTPSLTITLDRSRARVADQLATLVPVQVRRAGGLEGAVEVTLEGGAAWGIAADRLVIPAGSDVGVLQIHSFASDPGLSLLSGTVVARSGELVASVGIELDVSGRSGAPEREFGTDGVITTHTVPVDLASAVAAMDDGRYVTAGTRGGTSLVVQRRLANGQPDVAFFGSGELVQTIGAGTHQVNTLEVYADGRILVGGFVGGSGFLARYLANGQPDDGFGASGVLFVAEGDVKHVRVRPDGRIVVVDDDGLQCHLRGLDATAQADASFAGGAVVTIDRGAEDYCSTFALRADGSVVVFGSNGIGGGYAVAYDAQGQADTGFGSGGVCAIEPNGNDFVPEHSLALDDGRMIVASSYAVVALSSNCHSWPTFGTDGYLPTYDTIGGMATDGHRIYRASSSGNQSFVCASFMDGVPDESFGPEGCGQATTFAGTPHPKAIAVAPGGSLLTVGSLNLGPGDFDSFLVRNVGLVR